MINVTPSGRVMQRPKYPSPPRSGNAFAAAVIAAMPSLMVLMALIGACAE